MMIELDISKVKRGFHLLILACYSTIRYENQTMVQALFKAQPNWTEMVLNADTR